MATVACGIAIAIVLNGSGKSDTAKGSRTTSGRVFTDAPDGCSLLKPATIDAYAPGATCTPSPFDKPTVPGLTTRRPEWSSDASSGANGYVSIGVDLSIGSGVLDTYSSEKDSTAHMFTLVRDKYRMNKSNAADMYDGDLLTLKASHPLTGVGDEAHLYYGISTASDRADAELVARSGNAEFTVSYSGTREGPGVGETPVARREAEAALTAVARDVLKSLR
ncbi:hypothetical protein OG842_14125 [Streptomyces sp. NBC_00376]|uniref:hypothetical protein n=1 Tax=Streptomyces sp. NPDC087538 TaxID=3365797 RepID=UPI003244B95A